MYAELSTVPGLSPVMPAGAMYMMVGIDLEHYPLLTSAVNFMEQLMSEQSVFCLPGEVRTQACCLNMRPGVALAFMSKR